MRLQARYGCCCAHLLLVVEELVEEAAKVSVGRACTEVAPVDDAGHLTGAMGPVAHKEVARVDVAVQERRRGCLQPVLIGDKKGTRGQPLWLGQAAASSRSEVGQR